MRRRIRADETRVSDVIPAEKSTTAGEIPHLTPQRATECTSRLRANIERALRGKPDVVRRAVETLIAGGHLLLEDVPGVGKTTLAHALARSIDAKFRRVQFTSDLLPGDLMGASMPEVRDGAPTGTFIFHPGPIFANVVLADEINRASPKAQSALLEAMSDGSVSVDGVTRMLPRPFFVVATQNPMEHHGTHPLPESQLDRFMMCIGIGYPDPDDEACVLRDDPAHTALPKLDPVVTTTDVVALQEMAEKIKFDESLVAYLLAIVHESRNHECLELGVSPRAAIALRRTAQARALVDGRDYCIPEDVRDLAVDVLAHRIVVDPRSGRTRGGEETTWVLREILERVPVPL
jgi:MoxR-like ATPase